MSGASALAAARRRRANPQPTSNSRNSRPSNQPPMPQNEPISAPTISTNSSSIKFNNPAQLLKHVFEKTEKLERIVLSNDNLNEAGLKGDIQKLLTQNSQKMEMFDKKMTQNDRTITNVLSDFENRISKMEEQIDKLKEMCLKVQTFSMETNLAMMMFKKELANSGSLNDISMNMLVESFKQEGVVEEELLTNVIDNTSLESINIEASNDSNLDTDSTSTNIDDIIVDENNSVNVVIQEEESSSSESLNINNETDLNNND
jgi:hypothetical protein